MTSSDEQNPIKWVTLTLDFTPEQEAVLEAGARTAGLSVKCFCVHVLYKHLLNNASAVEKEKWLQEFPETLRRNGCSEDTRALREPER